MSDPDKIKPLPSGNVVWGRILRPARGLFWALVVFLVVAEIGARCYIRFGASPEKFELLATQGQRLKQNEGSIHSFHRYLVHSPTPNYRKGLNKHNSLGYRGEEIVMPKPQGEFRIACLGGSTTYGETVDDYHDAYPAVMEALLRQRGLKVTVINAGCPGYTSYEDLINLAFRVIYLDVDMVILDSGMTDWALRAVWPPELYKSDHSATGDFGLLAPSILEVSAFYRMVALGLGLESSFASLGRAFGEDDYSVLRELGQQAKNGVYPSGRFANVSLGEVMRRNPPIYYAQNLASIVAVASTRDIPVVLTTFACFYEANQGYDPHFLKDMKDSLEEMNDVTRQTAQKTGAMLFDLAKAMPYGREYWRDFMHENKAGVLRKAELIADYVAHSGIIDSTHNLSSP